MSWRARFVGGPEDGVERYLVPSRPYDKPDPVYMMATCQRCRTCERRAFGETSIPDGPEVERHVYVAVAYYEDDRRQIVVYAYNEPRCKVTRC